jgi:hypothetical protein
MVIYIEAKDKLGVLIFHFCVGRRERAEQKNSRNLQCASGGCW